MTTSTSPCLLEAANLHDTDQAAELQRQRVICGWDYDTEVFAKWTQKQDEGLKNLFWITITSPDHGNNERIRAGHISLDAYADPPDPDLARADKSVMTIHSFFILPDYRAYGLGRHAMRLAEALAVEEPYGSPNCRAIALTGLSKRYIYDDAPEWRGIWPRLGMEVPSFSIQEWYEKLGYVSWKEEPLYEETALDGEVIPLVEAFMKKRVQ